MGPTKERRMADQDNRTAQQMIDEMLEQGGSGRTKRHPRPGEGRHKLLLTCFKEIAEVETKTVITKEHGPQVAEVKTVKGIVLEARVLESTCAENPPGSMTAVYFEHPEYADIKVRKMRSELLVDFVVEVLKSLGETKATKALYEMVTTNEGFVRGIVLDMVATPAKYGKNAGDKKGQIRRDEAGNAYLEYQWSAVRQTAEDVAKRRAELASA